MGRRIIYINKSILKWPGGKERELYQIKNLKNIQRIREERLE